MDPPQTLKKKKNRQGNTFTRRKKEKPHLQGVNGMKVIETFQGELAVFAAVT